MTKNIVDTLNTTVDVENYRKTVNEACDRRIDYINLCKTAGEAAEKSYGYIKEAFEAISPSLFSSADGKKIIKKYTAAVKGSWNLSSLHHLYEAIRKSNKDSDVDFLMENIANEDWNIDKKTLSEDICRLGRILAEGILCVGTEAAKMLPSEKKSLDLSVMYIAENKKTSKNLAEYSSAIKTIRENVLNNEGTSNGFLSEGVDLDNEIKKLCEDFNKKYNEETLSSDEVKALKELLHNDNREKVFNEYKEACMSKIDEAKKIFDNKGDKPSSERLATVMEQVNGKSYNSETVGDDICSLIQLTNVLAE